MTRGDILALAKSLLNERPGSEAAMNPFQWDYWINHAASELCRATDCYYLSESSNLVANQGEYAPSCLYKIKSAQILLADGATVRLLRMSQPSTMDRCIPYWRTAPAGQQPLILVTGGLSVCWLYPAPDYAMANGLTLEGYGTPCGDQWALATDECPLPEIAHMGVAYRAAMLRATQMGDASRMEMLDNLYRTEKGRLERDVKRLTTATRGAAPDGYNGSIWVVEY